MTFLDIANALLLCVLSLECFRILQSCNYKPLRGYYKIFASRYFLLLVVTQVLSLICLFLMERWCCTIALLISAVLSAIVKRKCPLKFTKRIGRMMVVQTIVLVSLYCFVDCSYIVIALPVVTIVSLLICLPMESLVARYYLQRAQKKLSQSNVMVIAITGSYGKTCTKDMLASLLNNAIAPKGSCNTPLGIARFINNTDLTTCKFLILEFGARNRGDIAQLCKLFPPACGIITGICAQHLSTFKSVDNILRAKGELVQSLPEDGVCVFNGRDESVLSLMQSGVCRKVCTTSKIVHNAKGTLEGTMFDIVLQDITVTVHLPQISNYIIDTFLMCFEMCVALGQSAQSTVENCSKVSQTPHRMEISHKGSFWIIDDAYNGNVKGVASCCKTLSKFPNYKIVLTQGIVEGGKFQQQLNEQCGALLGQNFDVVIAVGRYAKYLTNGIKDGRSKVVIVKNLTEGIKILQKYVKADCIVLFQNDLPDVVSL